MVSDYDCYDLEQKLVIQKQISLVRNHVKLLAGSVNSILNTAHSQVFLEVIYTPFIAHLLYYKEFVDLNPCNSVFMNFGELYDFIVGDEAKSSGAFERDIEWKSGVYDLTLLQSLNAYEKLIYRLYGISYLEMKYVEPKQKIVKSPRYDLRIKLKEIINIKEHYFPYNIVEFLPYTLFEGLKDNSNHIDYPSTKVHLLSQIHNEKYLFYLAYLKEQRVLVIGEPHGGGFSQVTHPFPNEIAEMILSDVYHAPSWLGKKRVFPNSRASRNLFLNIKDGYRNLFNKNKSKLLVYLGVFYQGKEPPFNKSFVKDGFINSFYIKRLEELGQQFSIPFDFKMHPAQGGNSEIKNLIKGLYPNCNIISEGSARMISHNYDGVIYFDFWGTGIIELASTNVAQYVYLGPELSITKEYEYFLWNTRKSSTRDNILNGTYVEIDNRKYREVYGASYFYPFYFSNLIKKLII